MGVKTRDMFQPLYYCIKFYHHTAKRHFTVYDVKFFSNKLPRSMHKMIFVMRMMIMYFASIDWSITGTRVANSNTEQISDLNRQNVFDGQGWSGEKAIRYVRILTLHCDRFFSLSLSSPRSYLCWRAVNFLHIHQGCYLWADPHSFVFVLCVYYDFRSVFGYWCVTFLNKIQTVNQSLSSMRMNSPWCS